MKHYIDYEDDESELPIGGDRIYRPCCRSTHRKRERKKKLGTQRRKNPHPSAKLDAQYTYYLMNRERICRMERARQARIKEQKSKQQ